MVGVNNGVYKKHKEEIPALIHIPCVCHSLQLAVSAAASKTLPRNIDYLIRETYNWFCHSTLRQAQYENLYMAINDGHDPLKIVRSCETRWLSIESAVSFVLNQWLELKTLFSVVRTKETCYAADVLFEMYNDNMNLAHLKFLYLILEEVQLVNKSFESNTADPSKLLKDLTNLIYSVSKRFVNPNCREDPLTSNMNSYTVSVKNVYFGYEFEQILASCPSSKKKDHLKERCLRFLQVLLQQLQQRLPKNVNILQTVSL